MARIGINPARDRVIAYRPARVTVAVLTYIPLLQGYFSTRLDTLKLCLASILKHTDLPYDLLVFDNASCVEVKDYLRQLLDEGAVRFVVTASENVGKLGALRLIAGTAPGEVIAYTDDDALFYPGWLGAHLRLFDGFPRVGMVSGSPWRTLFDHAIGSNLRLAQTDPDVRLEYGQTIPDDWETDYALSLGRDVPAHLELVHGMQDILIERRGLRGYAAASHNQFVIPKDVLTQFTRSEWSGRLMGGMNEFDQALDDAGYLRLMTVERTVKNIGGVITPELRAEARSLGLSVEAETPARRRHGGLSRAVLRWKPARRLIQGLYNRLFWLLNAQSGGWMPNRGDEVARR